MNTVKPRQKGEILESFVNNSWRFSVESLHERRSLCVEVKGVKGGRAGGQGWEGAWGWKCGRSVYWIM